MKQHEHKKSFQGDHKVKKELHWTRERRKSDARSELQTWPSQDQGCNWESLDEEFTHQVVAFEEAIKNPIIKLKYSWILI